MVRVRADSEGWTRLRPVRQSPLQFWKLTRCSEELGRGYILPLAVGPRNDGCLAGVRPAARNRGCNVRSAVDCLLRKIEALQQLASERESQMVFVVGVKRR